MKWYAILGIIIIVLIVVIGIVLCYSYIENTEYKNPDENSHLIGGDKDAHGCIGSAGYSWCEAKQKCLRVWEEDCNTGNEKINLCPAEHNPSGICTLEYRPVCGWFSQNIKCIKYPCAIDASNPCTACTNEDVNYWTEGECPKTQ